MRKLAVVCSLCLLAGVGCFDGMRLRDEPAKPSPAPVSASRPPPVRPDSINESNAHAKAQELAAELDFEAQQNSKAP
jgi:hypothetical protein